MSGDLIEAWWQENPVVRRGCEHPTDLCKTCGVSRDRHPTVWGCSGEPHHAEWHTCDLPPSFQWDNLPGVVAKTSTWKPGDPDWSETPFRSEHAVLDQNGEYVWWIEKLPEAYEM